MDSPRSAERSELMFHEIFQRFLADRLKEYYARQRLSLVFNPAMSAWQLVHELLESARAARKEGPVAQYLAGAALQARYPEIDVQNYSYGTSDLQQGGRGDFLIGDTAFHVTVSPMASAYDRCRVNLQQGFKAYLIVPDRSLEGTRQNAEAFEPGRIFVDSLEAFVGRNAAFSPLGMREEFIRLLAIYNNRVDSIETDKSIMIKLRPALSIL